MGFPDKHGLFSRTDSLQMQAEHRCTDNCSRLNDIFSAVVLRYISAYPYRIGRVLCGHGCSGIRDIQKNEAVMNRIKNGLYLSVQTVFFIYNLRDNVCPIA